MSSVAYVDHLLSSGVISEQTAAVMREREAAIAEIGRRAVKLEAAVKEVIADHASSPNPEIQDIVDTLRGAL